LKFYKNLNNSGEVIVALFTGAWIEMREQHRVFEANEASRSLRARGLKYIDWQDGLPDDDVALFTGAWIEIAPLQYCPLTV